MQINMHAVKRKEKKKREVNIDLSKEIFMKEL